MKGIDRLLWIRTITLSLVISACGGGKGSSSPATPVPIPPSADFSQQVPGMELDIEKTTLYEGEVFEINAENVGGEDVSIRQTGGEPVEVLENINPVHFQFRAPDFDFDIVETIHFEVTASNAAGTSTRDVEFAVRGYAGFGRTVAEFDSALKLVNGNGNPPIWLSLERLENIISIEDRGYEKELIFLGGKYDKRDYAQVDQPIMDYVFSDITAVRVHKLGYTLTDVFSEEFSVLQEESNSIKWFVSEHDHDDGYKYVSFQDEILIDSPCELVGRTSTGEDFVWIGQRNRGFSTVRLEAVRNEEGLTREFDDTLLQSVDNGRSLCFIYPTTLPNEIVPPHPYKFRIPDLITLDYDSNELVLFADANFDEQYEEITTIPLQTESSGPLNVVDVFSSGWPNQSPRYIVVLLTDGQHLGEHRLVVVSQGNNLNIEQKTFSWDEGVPVSLLYGTFSGAIAGDQFRKDIVVVRKESEYALYFDNLTPHGTVASSHPIFSDPVTFSIGFRAESAVVSSPRFIDEDPENFAVRDIMVSYPETRQLRVFRVHDLVQQ